MKYLITIFTLFSISLNISSAQKKELRKAVKDGKNSSLYYEANFKKVYKTSKIESWLKDSDYILLSYVEGEIARFGGFEKGIVGVRFITKKDYNYLVEQERKRKVEYAAARRRAAKSNSFNTGVKVVAGLAALYVAWQGTKWVAKKALSSPPSSSYTDYSISQPVNKKQLENVVTLNSDVRYDPISLCSDRAIKYKAIFNDGSTRKFYFLTKSNCYSANKPWLLATSLAGKTQFESKEDLVNYIIAH